MKRFVKHLLPALGATVLALNFIHSASGAEVSLQSPSTDQDRLLRWYQSKTVSAYRKSSYTNSRWNDPAEKALELYSQMSARPSARTAANRATLVGHLQSAIDAGCNDPLIRYLELNYMPETKAQTSDKFIAAWVQVAQRLDKSRHYTTALKFKALLRVWNIWVGYNTDPSHPPPQYTDALNCYNRAYGFAKKIVNETNTPPEIAYEACAGILRLFERDKNNGLKTFYDSVKNDLARKFPENAWVSLLRGKYHIDYAWQARGNGAGNTVPEEGGRLFVERMQIAEEALEKAWRLDPTIEAIPLEMMRVLLGLAPDQPRLELWFQRAMTINTNSYEACLAKLQYLLPQWYGSNEATLEFGRQCVASTKWGGEVPWTLIQAHWHAAGWMRDKESRDEYWQDKSVWPDLKMAFEKCLKTMPERSNHLRHMYIRYARDCRQWDEMDKQLRLLTTTNFNYFGGSASFNEMLERGEAKTNQPAADKK